MPYLDRPDGARLYYRDEGAGPIVVLVHGGTGTGDYDWEYLRPALSGRFRVISPDTRGHGRSSDPRWLLGLETMGQDILALIEEIGGRPAVLVGFSMGGNALLRLLSEQPGMADVFVGIGLSVRGDAERLPGQDAGPWPRELIALEHEHGEGDDHWRRLRERMGSSWVDDLSLDAGDLARITLPTLVVCGDRDAVEPVERSVALARALPAGELLVLPRCGHFAIRDRPAEFAVALTGFVDRHLTVDRRPSEAAADSRPGAR